MPTESPDPVSTAEKKARYDLVVEIARRFGFVGSIEYRHVYPGCGGAQYARGPTIETDILLVDADAFRRDSAGEDFTLEAIIAHERGHQVVHRNEALQRFVPAGFSVVTEEVVASLVGSLLVGPRDAPNLVLKAIAELVTHGMPFNEASLRVEQILDMLEAVL